jgi:RNA polymerase sigma-70 factor (ECF subfamily)
MSARTWKLTDSETSQLLAMARVLRGYFVRRTKQRDVESLVGITLIEAGARFEGRSTLQHFVFAIAKRKVAEVVRTRVRRRARAFTRGDLSLDAGTGVETLLDRLRHSALLDAALAQVPELHREVVRLWLAGWDNLQIAAELGLNYNTTRSRLRRGKKVLLRIYRPAIDA